MSFCLAASQNVVLVKKDSMPTPSPVTVDPATLIQDTLRKSISVNPVGQPDIYRGDSWQWCLQQPSVAFTAAVTFCSGILIGLGSDWSPTGSKNLLGELKVARLVSQALGGLFTDREIVAMATRRATVTASRSTERTSAKIAGGVDKAVEIGVVDEVVEPSRTRSAIARAMRQEIDTAGVRRGQHGNIPL